MWVKLAKKKRVHNIRNGGDETYNVTIKYMIVPARARIAITITTVMSIT